MGAHDRILGAHSRRHGALRRVLGAHGRRHGAHVAAMAKNTTIIHVRNSYVLLFLFFDVRTIKNRRKNASRIKNSNVRNTYLAQYLQKRKKFLRPRTTHTTHTQHTLHTRNVGCRTLM